VGVGPLAVLCSDVEEIKAGPGISDQIREMLENLEMILTGVVSKSKTYTPTLTI